MIMHKLKEKLNNNFTKNIVMVTSGAAFSQVITAIFTPLITRIYTPEEYGLLSIYTAILGTLSFIGTLNYDMGIPISSEDKDAVNTLMGSLVVLLFNITLFSVVIIFWGHSILNLLDATAISNFLYLIPIGLLFRGLYSIFIQWAYRDKDFKTITRSKYIQSLTSNLSKFILGLVGLRPVGLLIGFILGELSGVISLLISPLKRKKYLIKEVYLNKIFEKLKIYKDFPLYTTPRRYLGDITISFPILFLTGLYSSQVAGLYGLANSIIQIPMNLIGTSIENVYYAECASLKNTNPKEIKNLSNKLLKVLIKLGALPFIVLVVFGPLLFGMVFGNEWIEAGVYARILSISIYARFVFKPISNIFDLFQKQKLAFFINIFRITIVVIVFGISLILDLNNYTTILLYSIAMALVYFIQYLGAQKIIENI